MHRRVVAVSGVRSTASPRKLIGTEASTPAESVDSKKGAKRRQRKKYKFLFVFRAILVTASGAYLLFCVYYHNSPIETLRTGLGLRARSPIKVQRVVVRHHDCAVDFIADQADRGVKRRTRKVKDAMKRPVRLLSVDEGSESTRLSREWDLISTVKSANDDALNISQVDTNVCLGSLSQKDIRCLPSLFIVGFEKCSTTAISVFLSHHPNLQSRWLEGRFFEHVRRKHDLEGWYDRYLTTTVPTIPGGNVGQYWAFEKSPAYASSPAAPEMLSTLLPSAKLLFVMRNPTQRAYSMFVMYTSHWPNVASFFRVRRLSFFIKNLSTGDVRYVGDPAMLFNVGPGVGGTRVPTALLPSRHAGEEWRFLSFPPDPRDFDSWVRYALGRAKEHKPKLTDNSRPHRLLFGGMYASYLRKWLRFFPPENFVLLQSELFYAKNETPASLAKLQETLGLPLYDYRNIGTFEANGRFDIKSPGSFSNEFVNGYNGVPQMLDETRVLLDEFYCEDNKDLSVMLGGRSLPGYACADHNS